MAQVIVLTIFVMGLSGAAFVLGRMFEHKRLPIPPPFLPSIALTEKPEPTALVMEAMEWNAKVDSIPVVQRTPIPDQETRQ